MGSHKIATESTAYMRAVELDRPQVASVQTRVGTFIKIDPHSTDGSEKGWAIASATLDTVYGIATLLPNMIKHAPDTLKAAKDAIRSGTYNALPLHLRLLGEQPVANALAHKTQGLSRGLTNPVAKLKHSDAISQAMIQSTLIEPTRASVDAFANNTWSNAGDAYWGTNAFLRLAPMVIARTPAKVPAASAATVVNPIAAPPKLQQGTVIDVHAVRVESPTPGAPKASGAHARAATKQNRPPPVANHAMTPGSNKPSGPNPRPSEKPGGAAGAVLTHAETDGPIAGHARTTSHTRAQALCAGADDIS